MSRRATLSLALALALTLLAGCAAETPPATAPAAADPGHIHGLGADPATGKIYVAGHFGLFTLEGGRPQRVGDGTADHMGFTVASPGTFYASGHPPADRIAAGSAPHLGLIRSTDAGRSWTQVALAGTADFHALQVAGERVYGYDSQTGKVWRGEGGKLVAAGRLDLLDLAAGADDPDRLLATTPDGVKVSTDGGERFEPLAGAPLLSFVDVTGRDALTAIAPDGRIHASTDGGRTWRAGGRLDQQAVAFTAVSATHLLAAAMDGSVHESTDGGASFRAILRP
ncbi:F510_1955 family glycosylhydrolase [Nonomuraea sp. NPDC050310]|uniref:F510_1955 family glycosylhydrolase n=1 Tax=Nonomuraea sp. NPDC050310 TaxID=3154935 RepID=UPI0033FD7143